MRYIFLISLILVVLGAAYLAEPISNDNVGKPKSEQVLPLFRDSFQELMSTHFNLSGTPGAAIAVVVDTATFFNEGYGTTNVDSGWAVTPQTVFRLASVSKGFAGILSHLIFAQHDSLDLDSHVQDWVPQFGLANRSQGESVQIRHLLSHSTGLRGHTYSRRLEKGETLTELIPRFKRAGLEGPLGYHQYQNASFALIEPILERATGVPFDDLMDSLILTPLEMNSASTSQEEMDSLTNKAYPHAYKRWPGRYVVEDYNGKYYNAVAAGGINASMDDMIKWMKALLGQRPDVVPKDVLASAFSVLTHTHTDPRSPNRWDQVDSTFYASGWRVLRYKDRSLIYHGGYVNEFRSEILLDTTYQTGICALFNSSSQFSSTVIPTFLNLSDVYRRTQSIP